MDWDYVNSGRNYNDIRRRIEEKLRPDTYGLDSGDWNLTDIIREPSGASTIAMQVISGEDKTGKKDPTMPPMQMPDGSGDLRFRLKVLTRQACGETNDGKVVNGWSAGNALKGSMTRENTVFPEYNEPPQQGDVVLINMGRKPGLTPQKRDAMLARGESPNHYIRKPVDADGCIWCNMIEAVQSLKQHGKRIVFPEFRRPDKMLDAEYRRHPETAVKPRQITQWHFEEVPQDYIAPKKRGRPSKTDKAVSVNGS